MRNRRARAAYRKQESTRLIPSARNNPILKRPEFTGADLRIAHCWNRMGILEPVPVHSCGGCFGNASLQTLFAYARHVRLRNQTPAMPSVISAIVVGSGTPVSVMVTVVVPFVNVPMPVNDGTLEVLKKNALPVPIRQGPEAITDTPVLQPALPPLRSKRVIAPKEEVAMVKVV